MIHELKTLVLISNILVVTLRSLVLLGTTLILQTEAT